jgi:hypothetical protein
MKEREYITRRQVGELEGFLNEQNAVEVCDRSHRLTRAWCQQENVDPDSLVDFLIQSGGFCDCHVPDLLVDLYCREMSVWRFPTTWRLPDRVLAAVGCARESE